jgi:hypothetical protein
MRTAAEPTLKLGGMFVWEKWPEFFRGVDRFLKRPDQLGDLSSRHRLVLLACSGDSLVGLGGESLSPSHLGRMVLDQASYGGVQAVPLVQ